MSTNATVWEAARAVMRGVWAVLVLFLTAADTLISASLSVPPAAWVGRRVRLAVSEGYRVGYWNAIDAEIIEPGPDAPDEGPEEGGT